MLYNNLYDTDRNLEHITLRVYNMIKMAYLGKFVIFAWVLKLHIHLLKPETLDRETWIAQLTRGGLRDLDQYKTSLGELVNMCIKHKYIEKRRWQIEWIKNISEHDNFNTQLHKDFNSNISPLPLSFDQLYLGNITRCKHQIEPLTSVSIGWNKINLLFQNKIIKITEQLSTQDWIRDPLKNLGLQQMFLDIVRSRLYCFVWVQLIAYQKVDYSNYNNRLDYFYRLDFFMSLITNIFKLINIEDQTLNEVLTLYSTLNKVESNHEHIEKLLTRMTIEVNNLYQKMYSLQIYKTDVLVDISHDDLRTERAFDLYLDNIEKKFQEFGDLFITTADGFSFSFLLFFINGSNNTKLIFFPSENFISCNNIVCKSQYC
ncbi:uncharacterized protein LOC126840808 [Adelges cooleyi]|uniref:uncharacterized protein LOC126840808 n=1 Tax=Adelges cooleyi TaxID=133065 RepID=UPI00217F6CE4|nr:uncharacterized protein LOC126840808 [Adelges cooleyi]